VKPVPGLTLDEQPEPVVFACALCGEARGDGRPGMEAVAQVVMNRVNHRNGHFGSSAKEVLLRPWQFSCFNKNDPNRAKMLDFWHSDPKSYALAEEIVSQALGGALPDTVGPATHYCTLVDTLGRPMWNRDDSDKGHPAWHSKQEIEAGRTKETARIGGHVYAVAR